MDTRSKILSAADALRLPGPLTVATGRFDVPRAEQLEELRAARVEGAALLAVVLPAADALLDQHARAEMAAALRMVDYVVIASEQEAEALIEGLRPAAVARLEQADARRARELREHVRNRHPNSR